MATPRAMLLARLLVIISKVETTTLPFAYTLLLVNCGRGCTGQDAGHSALPVWIFVTVHVGAERGTCRPSTRHECSCGSCTMGEGGDGTPPAVKCEGD